MMKRLSVRLPVGSLSSGYYLDGRLSANTKVNSAFHPSGVGKLSTSLLGWGTFTCVTWQVTLCDPMQQMMLRSSAMGFP